MKKTVCFLAILSLVAIIDFGECLNCYTCSSMAEPDCLDPVKHNMATHECQTFYSPGVAKQDSNPVLNCVKIVAKVGDTELLTRGCTLVIDNVDICANMRGENKAIINCSLCDTNGCNA
ncbi:hypothetical protein ILUMI_05179 [Ignelater luminosus]|uniref:Protein sleepless n=1 Tax=Ignelater luminosus TaxID=2038154 RepID=A0A8K0DDF4_IGNLU|nr:hypothetical protein ILUMI_05179 [Ignelater luminosus]